MLLILFRKMTVGMMVVLLVVLVVVLVVLGDPDICRTP